MEQGFLRRQYHWVVLVVIFLAVFCTIGVRNAASIYIIPLCSAFGISRGVFSLSSSISSLAAVFSNMAFGFVYHKLGYRKMATLGLLVVGAGFALQGSASNIYVYYLASAMIGIMECCASFALASRAITEWFNKHRGLILGIVMAASGVGGSIFTLLLNGIMERHTYHQAFYTSAGILWAVGLLMFLLARNKPSDMGLEPYGGSTPVDSKKPERTADQGLPIAFLKKRPVLYFALLDVFLLCLGVYSMLTAVNPHVQDLGMSASFAAKAQSVSLFAMAVAKILEGELSDRFGTKPVLIGCLLTGAAGIFLFSRANSEAMVLLSVLLFAFGISTPTVLVPQLAVDLFGTMDYSVILGLFLAANSLNNTIISAAVNFSYDILGTYVPALTVGCGLVVFAVILTLLVYRGAKKARRDYEAAVSAAAHL